MQVLHAASDGDWLGGAQAAGFIREVGLGWEAAYVGPMCWTAEWER